MSGDMEDDETVDTGIEDQQQQQQQQYQHDDDDDDDDEIIIVKQCPPFLLLRLIPTVLGLVFGIYLAVRYSGF
jgi:hypothetical protein